MSDSFGDDLMLESLRRDISQHANEIKRAFKPGAIVSIHVHNPSVPDADVLVSNAKLEDWIDVLKSIYDLSRKAGAK